MDIHRRHALFSIFIDDLGKDINSKMTKFAHDTKLLKIVK